LRDALGAAVVQEASLGPDAPERRRAHLARPRGARRDAVDERAHVVEQEVRVGMDLLVAEEGIEAIADRRDAAGGLRDEGGRVARRRDRLDVAARAPALEEERPSGLSRG